MRVLIADDAVAAASAAASILSSQLEANPDSVIGVATGSTPEGIYERLRALRSGGIDTTRARYVALDEYVGLDRDHPQSYFSVLQRQIVAPLGAARDNVIVPEGWRRDLDAAAADFEATLRGLGGVDIQLLGIGRNGHIGFNEPTSSLNSRTRVKTLAPKTRADNARFFGSVDDVPQHCLTQGLGTIREAREIVLVALGRSKAMAVARAVEGPLSAMCPASCLQLHPRTTVIVDPDAAGELMLTSYYRAVDDHDLWRS